MYKNDPTLVMFTSGPEVSDSEGTAVFIGARGWPMSLSYLRLSRRWRRSAGTVPGRRCPARTARASEVSDLDKDAEELDLVVDRIRRARARSKMARTPSPSSATRAPRHRALPEARAAPRGHRRAVLQAPVSDREAMCMEHGEEAIAAANAARASASSVRGGRRRPPPPRSTPGTFLRSRELAAASRQSFRAHDPGRPVRARTSRHEQRPAARTHGPRARPPEPVGARRDASKLSCSRRQGGSARSRAGSARTS